MLIESFQCDWHDDSAGKKSNLGGSVVVEPAVTAESDSLAPYSRSVKG
jgi:hypothetical protein